MLQLAPHLGGVLFPVLNTEQEKAAVGTEDRNWQGQACRTDTRFYNRWGFGWAMGWKMPLKVTSPWDWESGCAVVGSRYAHRPSTDFAANPLCPQGQTLRHRQSDN